MRIVQKEQVCVDHAPEPISRCVNFLGTRVLNGSSFVTALLSVSSLLTFLLNVSSAWRPRWSRVLATTFPAKRMSRTRAESPFAASIPRVRDASRANIFSRMDALQQQTQGDAALHFSDPMSVPRFKSYAKCKWQFIRKLRVLVGCYPTVSEQCHRSCFTISKRRMPGREFQHCWALQYLWDSVAQMKPRV